MGLTWLNHHNRDLMGFKDETVPETGGLMVMSYIGMTMEKYQKTLRLTINNLDLPSTMVGCYEMYLGSHWDLYIMGICKSMNDQPIPSL